MSPDSLIDALGGTSALAKALAIEPPVVSNWRSRQRIPAEFWAEIVGIAGARGVKGITSETLASMHSRRASDDDAILAAGAGS